MAFIGLIFIGLIAGILSGLVGVGGAVLIIPALIHFFDFSQKIAQGTSLAILLPPVGILAAMTYFQEGLVDLKAASLICLGFILGGLLGAKFAVNLSVPSLQKIFGVYLLGLSIKVLFFSGK
ncbi:MAG: sulfite exporter TauE/SafE family protein [Candidatus Caenarcaniphilales bacterium]|nr:sulfite exporter TauE/SafE family protein [Candidatus Caenarcaniphilales bacterium]